MKYKLKIILNDSILFELFYKHICISNIILNENAKLLYIKYYE